MSKKPSQYPPVSLKYIELVEDKDQDEFTALHCYVNGKFYRSFGDEYHNKATECSEAFEETLADLGYWVSITGQRRKITRKDEKLAEDSGDLAELLGFSVGGE